MRPEYDDSAMETFLDRVQQHSGLADRTEADRLTRATLRALSEAVSEGQMADLAEGLPEALRSEATVGPGQARAFDRDTFLERVSGGVSAVETEEVERQAHAVLQTIREWAPGGEISDTIAQLPTELSRLFKPARS